MRQVTNEFLEELRERVRCMTPQTLIFKLLKKELGKQGYWRNRSRGNPKKGFEAMKAKQHGQD